MGFVACHQVWATGHLHCDDDELDLCDSDDDGHGHGNDHGSTGQCDDPELDLCEDKADGEASSGSIQLHTFEGAGCAKPNDPPSMAIEMNKCTSIDSMTAKMTEKDADTIYLMLGESGCSDGEGVWGTGHALDCKKDGSECCDVSMDGGGTIDVSYKVVAPTPMPPTPSPTPAPQAKVVAPTPMPPTPSPTPAPQATEAADSANGQVSAALLASALGGLGTLLLNAA